ncbi:hypothetical protein EJ04DRAFT_554977 [Polyplosphaeria fusca]|uniref:SET domain-containing protein n=1 Tax=Polyplosphaeria fusca TaxID=682080 RepID=A0A9P4UZK1_9PLEO|nr:hypothetical protein EJ04DRAFT_554977 [Polyplosphaeria fusca]
MPADRKKRKGRPGKITKKNPYPNEYDYLRQKTWKGCQCDGECDPDCCPCQKDGKQCGRSCSCPASCRHRIRHTCGCIGKLCDASCSCFKAGYACGGRCGCECGHLHLREFPQTEVRESQTLGAGQGLFAKEEIPKGTIIGLMEGTPIRHGEQSSFNMFDLAADVALECRKEGVYFVNEKKNKDSNAVFKYIESSRRREVVLFAKKRIKKAEELSAQYTSPSATPGCVYPADTGDYILAKPDPDVDELWVGKVTGTKGRKLVQVAWLLRKEDVDRYLPSRIVMKLKEDMRDGELIMTKNWDDEFTRDYIVQTVFVEERKPEGQLHKNTWWWTRTYNKKTKTVRGKY